MPLLKMTSKLGEGPVNEAAKALGQSSEKFALEVYRVLSKKEGNVFVSPLSVYLAVALAHVGARGKTAAEIANIVHLPEDIKFLQEGVSALLETLKGNDHFSLNVANKIYMQQNFPVHDEFQSIAEKSFLAAAELVDYVADADGAAAKINQWVEEKTQEKIKNLIPPGVLNDLTRLVLVNAIYFKGFWQEKFKKHETVKEQFHVKPGTDVEVDMMKLTKVFRYAEVESLKSQVLELPYKGSNLKMLIVLPNEVTGINELENSIGEVSLSTLTEKLERTSVNVSLPKFRLEESTDFTEILQQMGLSSMFQDGADFSGITPEPGLKVSKVLHKAFVDVNEDGTEAAAATALEAIPCCLVIHPEEPKKFNADHPFIFKIYDLATMTSLFIGHLKSPIAN